MNFLYPIYTEQTECQDCYKCIRHCPVKAILVESGHAKIIPEQCVMCGTCVTNCPAKAKHIRDDLNRTRQFLKQKEKVYVSLAPSFVSEFSEYKPEQIIHALKMLGFAGVSETALGADFVSAQIAADMEDSFEGKIKQKLFLSSACPSVVKFIKQNMENFAPYITDRASPLLAHSRFLKEQFGNDIGVVFIGPCIAKKREADIWDSVDLGLTFNVLRNWFSLEHINPAELQADETDFFVPQRSAKGSLFPIDGGMIAAFKKYSKTKKINSMTICGIEEIKNSLKNFRVENLSEPLFMELLSCSGGCINGPGTDSSLSGAMKRVSVLEYAQNSEATLNKQLLKKSPKITGTLPKIEIEYKIHSEEEIQQTLRSVGKFSINDEINCSSCGYNTCRQFAEAVLNQKAEKTMCVSYIKTLAQKKANSLIKAIPSGVVISDKNLKIIECNYNFASMMGSDILEMYEVMPGLEGASLEKIIDFSKYFLQVLAIKGPDVIEKEIQNGRKIFHISVFAIEKEEIAGCVIEDITAPQVQKRRIIAQAKKVIDKNLSTVQKIAFLLGENAAESESILNSIIDSYSDGEEE
ncbi:MAG: [Fe-Fe] hydrogenase large subunit C-terminal domain-containing protein [Treponemataceae bacterium]